MGIKNKFIKTNKKEIYNPNKYSVWDAGLSFVLFTILFTFVGLCIKEFLKIQKVKKYFLDNYDVYLLFSTIVAQLVILIFTFVYSRVRKVGILSGGGFAFKFDFLKMLMGLILVMGVYFLFEPVHMDMANNSAIAFGGKLDIDTEDFNPAIVLLYSFVITPILPALIEEAFLRGVVFRSLLGYGQIFAIVCSGAMFAIFHGNPQQILLQFFGGMAFALALLATKNFFICCSMHFCYNFLISIFAVFEEIIKENSVKMYAFYRYILPIVGIVFICIGLTYFIKLMLASNKKEKGNKQISTTKKVYLFNTQENVIREILAYKTGEIDERLNFGDTFLYGKKFIRTNKTGNRIFGYAILGLSIIVGIVSMFV